MCIFLAVDMYAIEYFSCHEIKKGGICVFYNAPSSMFNKGKCFFGKWFVFRFFLFWLLASFLLVINKCTQ